MDDILRRAEEKTRQAFEVMGELDLLTRWSRCGRPSLLGAVSFGLVVDRDIDLNICSRDPSIERGFEVISEIASLPGVVKIRYSNCLDTIDQGLYWQIRYRGRRGHTWRVDNWLVSEDHPHAGLLEDLVERMPKILTTEHRKAILQIKESAEPNSRARGIDIYEAVIEHGVRSPGEFADWLGDGKRPVISLWLPAAASQVKRDAKDHSR